MSEPKSKGKFVLKPTKNGEFRFTYKAGNGEVMFVSETYKKKNAALHAINVIRENASGADLEEVESLDD